MGDNEYTTARDFREFVQVMFQFMKWAEREVTQLADSAAASCDQRKVIVAALKEAKEKTTAYEKRIEDLEQQVAELKRKSNNRGFKVNEIRIQARGNSQAVELLEARLEDTEGAIQEEIDDLQQQVHQLQDALEPHPPIGA